MRALSRTCKEAVLFAEKLAVRSSQPDVRAKVFGVASSGVVTPVTVSLRAAMASSPLPTVSFAFWPSARG